MAYQTGTCNGHKAFLGVLKTFLDAQGYTAERYAANDEYIFSKVYSGSDKWYSGIKIYDDVGGNVRALRLRGMTGYNSSADFDSQIGSNSTTQPILTLDENTGNANFLTYWITASARRVAGVIRIGTSYQHFYLGLILPYATPAQYPYPLITGGNSHRASDGTIYRYDSSNSNAYLSSYWFPTITSSTNISSSLNIRTPSGTWKAIRTTINDSVSPQYATGRGVHPYSNYYGFSNFNTSLTAFNGNQLFMKPSPDGCYNTLPVIIYDSSPYGVYGELEGFRYISGYSMTAESTFTESSNNYIVFPNRSNSGEGQFIAMLAA